VNAADIDRIERAQVCLQRARAESSEVDKVGLAGELTHHLDMVLRVVTGIRVMAGELDDVQLAVNCSPGIVLPHSRILPSAHNDEGQRTVMTVESDIAFHE
jgi:hypothetical protein